MRTHLLPLPAALVLALSAFGQSAPHNAAPPKSPVTAVPQRALPLALVNQLAPCKADALLISTDGEDGNFNGMSHGGTLIIIRNNGVDPCRLVPVAQATLLDKAGKPLGPFTTTVPGTRGMHPGPVVLPIAIAPNAEITASLRWISGPVFADNLCLSPATLQLKFGDLVLTTPLADKLYGERSKGVSADLTRFATDPVLQPAS